MSRRTRRIVRNINNDGIRAVKNEGAYQWRIYSPDGAFVGYARQNGSRLRSRSWDYSAPDGSHGRSSSLRFAAEALVRGVNA